MTLSSSLLKGLFAALVIALISACTSTGLTARDPEVRRQAILDMRDEVLTELYAVRPDTEAQIFSADGRGRSASG